MNEFESREEQYFRWYLDELSEAGLIRSVKYQPAAFKLFNGAQHEWVERLKTKTKEHVSNLLSGHQYQADFIIWWNREAEGILFADITKSQKRNIKQFPFIANVQKGGKPYSVVDVKGNYDQNDSIRRFFVDQKWVWQNFGVYVQKAVCAPRKAKNGSWTPANSLFLTTFVPDRYLLTDSGIKDRKISFPYKRFKEFIGRTGNN